MVILKLKKNLKMTKNVENEMGAFDRPFSLFNAFSDEMYYSFTEYRSSRFSLTRLR